MFFYYTGPKVDGMEPGVYVMKDDGTLRATVEREKHEGKEILAAQSTRRPRVLARDRSEHRHGRACV